MTTAVLDISERLNAAMAEGAAEVAALIEPEVGIYKDTDFLTYAGWDAASQSRLSRLVPPSTPAHLLAYMMPPPRKTEALIIGEATHCAILEPYRFDSHFLRAIEGDGRTKAVKDARERQVADFPHATIITAGEYDTTLRVRDAVHAHPAARALLDEVTERELSIVWTDPVTSELCKGRLDATATSISSIIDLKSTKNASRDAFAQSIRYYGYHRQGAFYMDGAAHADVIKADNYIFIAFEKIAPWAVAVYRLNDASLAMGRAELTPLLATYSECRRTNYYPAYSDNIEDIGAPEYSTSTGN